MSLIKALFLSGILTFVLSAVIHAAKYAGGPLHIAEVQLAGHAVAWSWPLFIIAGVIIWGIMLIMR